MKTLLISVTIGIAFIAGTILFLNRHKAAPEPSLAIESARGAPVESPPPTATPIEEPSQHVLTNTGEPLQAAAVIPVSLESPPAKATPAPRPTALTAAIDRLVSSDASFEQRQAVWKQLRDANQLDQVIEALKQGATENPTSAAYPAALGQAQLQKAGVIAENGGAISEMGILGMQADQSFDAALKLEPANWEAQFFKSAAMSHWPLELNKGPEVVQRLTGLIDQQDTMPPQPQFAQTYVLLGDQYRRMGKSDYATATWQLGAIRFPGNPTLQKRIRGD